MDDERQDSLREEERRMRGRYPIGMDDYGPSADFGWTGMLASAVIVLLMIGAGIFLLNLLR